LVDRDTRQNIPAFAAMAGLSRRVAALRHFPKGGK
jgi:hypothetical protein